MNCAICQAPLDSGLKTFCDKCIMEEAKRQQSFAPAPGSARLLEAAKNADWQQVVFNGGPPCFHLEDRRFCLRAERWDGHKTIGGSGPIHEYISLESLLRKSTHEAIDSGDGSYPDVGSYPEDA